MESYYEKHKDEMKKKARERYQEGEKYSCECGKNVAAGNREKHEKSRYHLSRTTEIEPDFINCDCGRQVKKNYIKRHLETDYHKKYAEKNKIKPVQ